MITYVYDPETNADDGGTYYPVILCDACTKPITEHGNVYWLTRDGSVAHHHVWHTHKDDCATYDKVIARSLGGGLVMWEELDTWLTQLANNLARLPRIAATNGAQPGPPRLLCDITCGEECRRCEDPSDSRYGWHQTAGGGTP